VKPSLLDTHHEVELIGSEPAPSELRWTPDPDDRFVTQPLWVIAGQLGVVIAVALGFGAFAPIEIFRPKVLALLLFLCVAATIALGPVRLINKLVLSAPVIAFVGWWVASGLWTYDMYGWWRDTQAQIPLILGCAALAGLLPPRAFRGALVAGCYVVIGYTVFQLAINPSEATVNPDGVPGWRGGFIHKNGMAPFMLFAGLVIGMFDRKPIRRNVALVVIAGLVIMSQSTTSIVAGVAVLLIVLFLRRLTTSTQPASAVLAVSAAGTAIVTFVGMLLLLPTLLELGGKDPTLSRRTEIWDRTWTAISERPLLGYGGGGVWMNPGTEPARSILSDLGFTVFHAHNGFLELLLLLGVVGMSIVAWLMLSTLRLAVAELRRTPDVAIFALGYLMLVILISLTEVATLGIWLALLGAFNCLLIKSRTAPVAAPVSWVFMAGATAVTLGVVTFAALTAGARETGDVDADEWSLVMIDSDSDRSDDTREARKPAREPQEVMVFPRQQDDTIDEDLGATDEDGDGGDAVPVIDTAQPPTVHAVRGPGTTGAPSPAPTTTTGTPPPPRTSPPTVPPTTAAPRPVAPTPTPNVPKPDKPKPKPPAAPPRPTEPPRPDSPPAAPAPRDPPPAPAPPTEPVLPEAPDATLPDEPEEPTEPAVEPTGPPDAPGNKPDRPPGRPEQPGRSDA
jgi:O-antigen ligase